MTNDVMNIHAGGFTAVVDAYARRESEVWFISLLGAQQAVKAIWARLVKGETAFLAGLDTGSGVACWLAREAWGTWRFHQMRLPSGATHHGMLVPEIAAYASDRREFLLLPRTDAEAADLHYRFLNRRLDLPLHTAWSRWLWDRALSADETEALDCHGISGYLCLPDVWALQVDITSAVKRGALAVPSATDPGFSA